MKAGVVKGSVFEFGRAIETVLFKQSGDNAGVGWLLDEIDGAQFTHTFPGFRLNVARDHDGQNRKILGADVFQHLVAVEFRHVQVQK